MVDPENEGRREPAVGGGTGSIFTWVILLMVCGVVGLGMFGGTHCGGREKARRINCAGNLKQIGLALLIYAGDDVEEGYLPDGETLARLHHDRYLRNGKVYGCPSRWKVEPHRHQAWNSDFVYLGMGVQDTEPRSSTLIVGHDRLGNHQGWVNCLYLDGHVKGRGTKATSWHEFRRECEAAGDAFANQPPWAGHATTKTEAGLR